jgi:hypothetical protein
VDTRNKWDRLDGESDKAFAAFCVYRDLGAERSVDAAYQKHSKTTSKTRPPHWLKWSAKYHWVDRVKAWDDHKDKEVQAALIVNEQTVINNELSDYEYMRLLLTDKMKKLKDAGYKDTSFEVLNLIEMMNKTHNMARRALKMPEKYTESKQDITSNGKELKALTASELSDDDLANIAARGSGRTP